MEFLRVLENLRVPVLDTVFSYITYLGDQMAFLAIGMIILWCVDKRWAYRLFTVGLLGGASSQLLKGIFLIPRPWVMDENFTIVESAREAATGYSFPSGHTQSVSGIFTTIAMWIKKPIVRVVCVLLIALTAFSRMYLGVHTPLDVSVGLILGIGLSIAAIKLYDKFETHKHFNKFLAAIVVGLCAILLLFVLFMPAREGNVGEFDAHGVKSAWTLLGLSVGFICIKLADEKCLKFETKAVWWAQILKFVIGIAIVMLLKSGLKSVFSALFGNHLFLDGIRYFLIAVAAGIVWPMTFKWWSRLGRKEAKSE